MQENLDPNDLNEQQQVENEQQVQQDPCTEIRENLARKEEENLRLLAEFDNFRKRTARERIENSKLASRQVIEDFLPVLDDIDRAQANINSAQDIDGIKDGVDLIMDKLWKALSSNGLEEMSALGEPFNPDLHEAVTEIPAPSPEQIGKVLDELEKGYKLNDVIIRFPKVVVGK